MNDIEPGCIMVLDGSMFPDYLSIAGDACLKGWLLVNRADARTMRDRLYSAGWNLFYLAGELRVIGFGSGSSNQVRSATARILAQVKSQHFNCAEITAIVRRRSFGIPYFSLYAHARHIQTGCTLDRDALRSAAQAHADWACG